MRSLCILSLMSFTSLEKLATFLELDAEKEAFLLKQPRFPFLLPRRLASKIKKNTLQDPLLRQFVPLQEERLCLPHEKRDPVCDVRFRKKKKLLHKYQGRALILATNSCAMHCRYCFRQNFAYETKEKGFQEELAALASDPSIQEVILSGGDPLSLSNERLGKLLQALDAIPHIQRIRFHTRFPIGFPERIDAGFLSLLKQARAQIWFVIHCNHAHELDADIFAFLALIQKLGIPVLNQMVLLKGVNDSLETLTELLELLVNNGILPYYIHQLDPVEGAHHFEVPIEEGKKLMGQLAAKLPGYAVPKYVAEIAGEPNKTPLY